LCPATVPLAGAVSVARDEVKQPSFVERISKNAAMRMVRFEIGNVNLRYTLVVRGPLLQNAAPSGLDVADGQEQGT
jgi:hypothetical protein